METGLKTGKISVRVGLLGIYLLLVHGCASVPKAPPVPIAEGVAPKAEMKTPEAMGPPEPFGPSPPVAQAPYGPEPVQVRPIVLVLGPGLARGYAYVGVFEALKEAKIPIGAVLGSEMGALVGALYSNSASINRFEWGLMKFKEDLFREKSGFLSSVTGGPSDGKKFEAVLAKVFDKTDLTGLKIPMKIVFQAKDTNALFVATQGSVAEAIRATMAVPELFTPGGWPNRVSGHSVVSAAQSRPFLVSEAREMGLGPVIVINVLSDAESARGWDELKGADLVIRPDVTGINPFDFQKRTDAAFRGKSATTKHLPEIRRLVGLPESDSDAKRSSYP